MSFFTMSFMGMAPFGSLAPSGSCSAGSSMAGIMPACNAIGGDMWRRAVLAEGLSLHGNSLR